MSRRARIAVVALLGLLGVGSVAGVIVYRRVVGADRTTRDTPVQLRARITALDAERVALRARLDGLAAQAPLLHALPDSPVRLMVPTTLVRTLVERVTREVADRIVVRVADVTVRRTGTIRRRLTLGDYDLRIVVDHVTASMTAGVPRLRFGANRIDASVALRLASGTGRATIDFRWHGRSVAGLLCGDMAVVQTVTGRVTPRSYPLTGALQLEMNATGIVFRPRLPRLTLHVDVEPSPESWAAAQQVLESKRGMCGVVLDRVDVLGAVRRIIDRGFDVRVPTERATAVALPVGLTPTLTVRGTPIGVAITLANVSLTPDAVWLGASVALSDAAPAAR